METLVLLLTLILCVCLIVVWTGFAASLLLTSRYELKKRAQKGDERSKIIYGLTADGRQVHVAILFGIVFVSTLITLILERFLYSLFASLLATLLIVIFGLILPFVYGEKLGLNITARLAPFARTLLHIVRPVIQPLANRIDKTVGKSSLLYSKEQLLKMIDEHASSSLTDISEDEARLVRHSLLYGSKLIRDVMVPRKVVTMVSSSDQVGPLLLNELHKSGHSRFPVYDPTTPDAIVGTLYVHDLVGAKQSGSVKSLMSPKVFFVHEELDLNHALDAFIKTKHHLFIVVNNFEEFVGILTIEDVLEQILGRQIVDEFDNYENLREVAALRARKHQYPKEQKHV